MACGVQSTSQRRPANPGPQVALDAGGNAVAVWTRFDSTTEPGKSVVQTASRPADGVWTAPVDLASIAQSGPDPKVAVDARGDAVVIWKYFDSSSYIVQAATKRAGDAWSKPVNLSAASKATAAGSLSGLNLAVNARGDTLALELALAESDVCGAVGEQTGRSGVGGSGQSSGSGPLCRDRTQQPRERNRDLD